MEKIFSYTVDGKVDGKKVVVKMAVPSRAKVVKDVLDRAFVYGMEEVHESHYPPLTAKEVKLVDTLAIWSGVKVKVQVIYDRETDRVLSSIERLDK